MSSSSDFVSPYYSPASYYTTVHELESDPIPYRSPSPAIEDEIQLLEPDKHDRDCFYARAVYRTWRSWKSPASSDPGISWDGNKCPLKSCDSRFKDISSMLTHLESECKALRSKVDMACSQARSTQTRSPVTTVSQAVENSGESQPRCSKCHSTWCRTKSFSNKGLNRIRSLHDTLTGRRKSTSPPDPNVVQASGPPSRTSSLATLPPPYSGLPLVGGAWPAANSRSLHNVSSAHEVHGTRTLEPVEIPAVERPSELDDTAPPVELPASSPVLGDSRPSPTCGIRSTPSKSFTGVSDMSEKTASTYGRDSLISVYSRPTVSSSSTICTLPQLCTTAKPIDSQGPIYAESLTLSPIDTEDSDLSSEVSFASEPQVETPVVVAKQFSAEHTINKTSASSPNCPSSVPPNSSEVNQQESYITAQSIPTATVWRPDPTPTNPTAISPEAPASLDQAFVAKLERLKLTLSNLLKPERSYGADGSWARSISWLQDGFALLGALDTIEKLLMGAEESWSSYKFCFAYLTMAMAVEIEKSDPETYHAGLREDFNQFVGTNGEVGLTRRFFNVANSYLNWLNTHNPTLGHGHRETDEEAAKRVHDNFLAMKAYLHENPLPRLRSASRQDSYSSTASTLVNDEVDAPVPPKTRSSSRTNSYDSTLSTSVEEGEEATMWPRTQASSRKRHRDEPAGIPCQRCDYTAYAPNQQKKLTRHYATQKHNVPTAAFSGRSAAPRRREDGVVICPYPRADGSPCESKFTKYTRKDNFKKHLERKHPEVNPENLMRGKRVRHEACY